jgi:hypothetical protein
MNLWRKRNRNRRKTAGRRFEMPKIALPRAGRIAGAAAAIAALGCCSHSGLDQPVRSLVIDGPSSACPRSRCSRPRWVR